LISWIVASHDSTVLEANLLATLQLHDDDEIHIVWNAESIANAYNEGQARATRPIRVYVHHDVQILDNTRLREQILTHCQPWVGVLGVVGSWNRHLPYWDTATCGSVADTRIGVIGPGKGGECAYLDGLLLAIARDVVWDESYPGWHLYDHDICEQALRQGLPNWCLTNGHELVRHNTTGTNDPDELPHWHENLARFREKWGLS
jgi:hypothetical protein